MNNVSKELDALVEKLQFRQEFVEMGIDDDCATRIVWSGLPATSIATSFMNQYSALNDSVDAVFETLYSCLPVLDRKQILHKMNVSETCLMSAPIQVKLAMIVAMENILNSL